MINNPTARQTDIFNAVKNTNDNIVIRAYAGSGKTTTLVCATNLIPKEKLNNSVFLAFNVAIANELKSRLPNVECRTFHSLFMKYLMAHLKSERISVKLHSSKARTIAHDVVSTHTSQVSPFYAQRVDSLRDLYNIARLTLRTDCDDDVVFKLCSDYDIPHYNGIADDLADAFQRGWDFRKYKYDFTDMLWVPYNKTKKFNVFDVVFVDELQDLNNLQRKLLGKISDSNTRVIGVGDPFQSIYGFAGSEPNSFDLFKQDYNCKELQLDVSFRVPSVILNEVLDLVPDIKSHKEGGEVRSVSYSDAIKLYNPKTRDFVLCRNNAPLLTLAFDLITLNIPAKIRGRDLVSQFVSTVKKAIGNEPFSTVVEALENAKQVELDVILNRRGSTATSLDYCEDRYESCIILATNALLAKVTNIKEFEEFCNEIYDENAKGVVNLSTIHKAKGLESDNVFILDTKPIRKGTDDQKQQEKNLLYVARTRAIKTLTFVAERNRSTIREEAAKLAKV